MPQPSKAKPSELGAAGEARAEAFLRSKGMQFVARNYACRLGEIDLIFLDGSCLVFVEVRLRGNPAHASGTETIGASKIRKLARTAEYFLLGYHDQPYDECRFDVIAIDDELVWLPDAFQLD